MPSEKGSSGQQGFISSFYLAMEDLYYGTADWLEGKGVKVYEWFIEPIEKNGIPSFPVAVLLLLAIAFGAYYLYSNPNVLGPSADVQISVLSEGKPVADAVVELRVEGERPLQRITNLEGGVTFEKIPSGKRATLKVLKEGFESYSKSLVTGRDAAIGAELKSEEPPTPTPAPRVTVLFQDVDTKRPIGGVRVTYQGPQAGVKEVFTNDDGSANLEFGEAQVRILVYSAYYSPISESVKSSDNGKVFYLKSVLKPTPTATPGPADGDCTSAGCPQPLESVSVSVLDEDNQLVDSRVELHFVGNFLSPKTAFASNGVASFPKAGAVGARVFAKAFPSDSAKYAEGESDTATIFQGGLDLVARVAKKSDVPAGATKLIAIEVRDERDNAVEGASVHLFLSPSTDAIASKTSGDGGKVSFEVASGQTFTLVAWKEGFLPSDKYFIAPEKTSQKMILKKLVIGGYANVNVSVRDEDGAGVTDASVNLRYSQDNLPLGIPASSTDETASAFFVGVPPNVPIKAVASSGAFRGESAAFRGQAGLENRVTVTLQRPTGRIAVLVRDPFGDQKISGAVIIAVERSKRTLFKCVTDANGACTLQSVPASTPIDVTVAAAGYLNYTMRGYIVVAGETLTVHVKEGLTPVYLANETRLTIGLYDSSCANGPLAPGTAIAKARAYCVRLDFNIPNASDPTGFFFRPGGSGEAGKDIASIIGLQDNDDLNLPLEKLAIKKAAKFGGVSCDSASSEQSQEWKWVNYEFNGVQGSRTVFLRVFVRANASAGSKLELNYFSYAVKDGKYFRIPFDASMGIARTGGGKDYCEAETNLTSYRIGEGNVFYNSNGGLSLSFEASPASASLNTQAGNSFLIKFTAEYFKQTAAPVIKIASTDPLGNVRKFIKFNSYSLSSGGVIVPETPLSGNSEETISFNPAVVQNVGGAFQVNGTINATTLLPVSLAKVRLELAESGAAASLVNVTASATITGKAKPALQLVPDGVPLDANADNTLTVSVTTVGVPVTDTIVSIAGLAGFRNPFGPNYADGDTQVVGDGNEGRGKNGKYAFRLRPTQSGKFAVVVGGAADVRFEETVREVEVRQNNFVQAFPTSLALGCAADRLELRNTLSFASALVNLSFSQSNPCLDVQLAAGVQCVQQSQFGCVKWRVSLAENEAKNLRITPKRGGACTLAISSSINPLTVSFSTVETSVSCSSLDPQCSLSASPASVFGGQNNAGANETNLTAVLRNLPLESPLFAEFNCGVGQPKIVSVFLQPNGDGIASARCQYSEVGSIATKTASVKLLNGQQLPASPELSCSREVLVAPKPAGPASCVLSSLPASGTFNARLRATYFNLLPTDSRAVFVCDERSPASAFGDAPLIYNPNTKTHSAEFECDYSGISGSVFNSSTAAGAAFCSNASTRILPPGPVCTLGSGNAAERMQFGQCSRNAPPLICGGNPSAPSLATDLTGTCCKEVLGNDFALETSGPTPYCKKVPAAPNTCGDGVTPADSCRTVTVDGKVRPTSLRCDSSLNFANDSSCCLAVSGFEFDAPTGHCKPVDVNQCVISSGSISRRVNYGVCASAPAGLRCSGQPTAPVLQGDTGCCQAIGQNYVWSEGNRSCVDPLAAVGPNNCDPFTQVGQCQQPIPNNPAWIPAPQSCFNVGSGPQWFFARRECCVPHNGKEYQMSDDGRVCVEVPAALIEAACSSLEKSLVLAPDGRSYSAQFNSTGRRLNNFFNGRVEFLYSCDENVQATQSMRMDVGTATEKTLDFSCSYPRGFFNTSVKPKARAVITSPVTGQQRTVECDLSGPHVNPDRQIILQGSSGQQPTFSVFATISNLNFSDIVPAPLGPLSGIKMTVRVTNMPPGLTADNLAIYLECDGGLQKLSMGFDSLSQNEWARLCSYSSPQTNRNWPVVHKPRAFYQVSVGDTVFPLAGVPPAFPDIREYAQPIAAGIEIKQRLQEPTLADQNLSLQLTARFRKLPLGLNNLFLTCEDENNFQQFAVNVGADGSANASKTCSYLSNAVAVSEYRFTTAQEAVAEAVARAELGIDYSPALPSAFCDWVGLPDEIVVGNSSGNRFSPEVVITGITAMPSSVEFDCGNGQRIPATDVVQIGQQGQEITVLATTTAFCSYDFSFLEGESSKVIQLNAFVNREECGPKTLTANSIALGSTRALLSQPEVIDDEGLGREVKVNITVVNPPDNFEQLEPTAVFDCGRGTATQGVKQEVAMEKQVIQPTPVPTPNATATPTPNASVTPSPTPSPTPTPSISPTIIFFAEAICSYNAVFNNTLRTIKGEVRAKPPYGRLVTIPPQVTFVQRAPNATVTNRTNETEPGINEEFRKCGGLGLLAALAPLLAQPPEPPERPEIPGIYPPQDYEDDLDRRLLEEAAKAVIQEQVKRADAFAVILEGSGGITITPRQKAFAIKYTRPLVAAATIGIVFYYAASDVYQKQNANAPPVHINVAPLQQDCLELKLVEGNSVSDLEIEHGGIGAVAVATKDATKCKQKQYVFTATAGVGQGGAASARIVVNIEEFPSDIQDLYCPMFSPKTGSAVTYRIEDRRATQPGQPINPRNRDEPGAVDPTQYANNLKDSSEVRPAFPFFLTPIDADETAAARNFPGIFGSSFNEPHRPIFRQGQFGRFGARAGTTITVVAPPGEEPTTGQAAQCISVTTTGPNSWTWTSGKAARCSSADCKEEWKSHGLGYLADFDVIGMKVAGGGPAASTDAYAPGGDGGGVTAASDVYQCSGANFCNDAQAQAVKAALEQRIQAAMRKYAENVQQLVPKQAAVRAAGNAAFGAIQDAMAKIRKRIKAQDQANIRFVEDQVRAQQAAIQAINQQGQQGQGAPPLGQFGPGQNGIPGIPPGGFPPFGGPEFQGPNRTRIIDGCIGVAACAAIMSTLFNSFATKGKKKKGFDIGKFLRLAAIPFCMSEKVQKSLANNNQGAFGNAFLGSPLAGQLGGFMDNEPPPTPGSAPQVTPIPEPQVGEIPPINIDPNLYTRIAASVIGADELLILFPYRGQGSNSKSSLQLWEFHPRVALGEVGVGTRGFGSLQTIGLAQEATRTADPRRIFSLIKDPMGYPYTFSPPTNRMGQYTGQDEGEKGYGAKFDLGNVNLWTLNKYISDEEAAKLSTNAKKVKCVLKWGDPTTKEDAMEKMRQLELIQAESQEGCDLTEIKQKLKVDGNDPNGCKPKSGCLFLYLKESTLVTGIVKAKKQRALTPREKGYPPDHPFVRNGVPLGILNPITGPEFGPAPSEIPRDMPHPQDRGYPGYPQGLTLQEVENDPAWPGKFVTPPAQATPLYSDSDKFKQKFAQGIKLADAARDGAKFFLDEGHVARELQKVDACLWPYNKDDQRLGRAGYNEGRIKEDCKFRGWESGVADSNLPEEGPEATRENDKQGSYEEGGAPQAAQAKCYSVAKVNPRKEDERNDQKVFVACTAKVFELT